MQVEENPNCNYMAWHFILSNSESWMGFGVISQLQFTDDTYNCNQIKGMNYVVCV